MFTKHDVSLCGYPEDLKSLKDAESFTNENNLEGFQES